VTVEKISLEILTDLHILIAPEYDKMVFGMMSLSLFMCIIWMCASLAPEHLD
jgi:hypothetical protein